MRNAARTAEEVIKAIKKSGGVKTTIAKRLNVTRQTVDNYLERWSTVREAYIEEKAGVDDMALSVVIGDIANKNVETAKWWISKKLDEFNPASKVTHDISKELLALLQQASPAERAEIEALFADVPNLSKGIEA